MADRSRIGTAQRLVVKVGSSSLTTDQGTIDVDRIDALVDVLARRRLDGTQIVLVSSGAIAAGLGPLGLKDRPKDLALQQAAASVGQGLLVARYTSSFARYGLRVGQVLLTAFDMMRRSHHRNAQRTLTKLLELGIVPIVNENDTVATEEIRFGDNDTLAAMVANLVEADLLVILTDQAGLFDQDPRLNPNARLVSEGRAGDPQLEALCSTAAGTLGRGGMLAKVQAGARAGRSGTATVIASGREPDVLLRVRNGEPLGTLLWPSSGPVAARKQWLANRLKVSGRLHIDAGAAKVLREAGRSLLPVGVVDVEGVFSRGELVACLGPDGREVARGLVNYDAQEVAAIKGQASDKIEQLLGYMGEPELIHRDNLVVTG